MGEKYQQIKQGMWADSTVNVAFKSKDGGSSHQVDQLSSHDSFAANAQAQHRGVPLPAPVSATDQQTVRKLRIDSQFSSVLEDVEMEQQTSPLRRKTPRNQQEQSFTNQTSQQSLLLGYGAAGFQIDRTSVVNPIPRQNQQQHNEYDRKIDSNQAPKQELISEIKYHYNQEKEQKAVAASAAKA
jgi:hypothetical protein